MDLNQLTKKLMNRVPKLEGVYKSYSVLVPIIKINDKNHLLFEVRSESLKTQPREICFPGGRIEPGENPLNCAIRETSEELNLSTSGISVIGPLDFLVLPYNFLLYPFLGFLDCTNPENISFNKDEVAEIFTVPLEFFMNHEPISHPIEIYTKTDEGFPYHMIQKGEDYNWKSGKYPVYFYTYGEHIIWGITARIIKNLVDLLKVDDDFL